MNQEFKEEWCQALESGKFEQGSNFLCAFGKYCCLGVAEELLAQKGILGKEVKGEITRYFDINNPNDGNSSLLNGKSVEYMGLNNISPRVQYEGRIVELTSLNDIVTLDFKTIASLIRAQL